jgi:hypothetical protein
MGFRLETGCRETGQWAARFTLSVHMPLPDSLSESIVAELPRDQATLLLWRIARRADELVIETQREPGLNRVCWLIAEEEITGHLAEAAMLISHEIHHSH